MPGLPRQLIAHPSLAGLGTTKVQIALLSLRLVQHYGIRSITGHKFDAFFETTADCLAYRPAIARKILDEVIDSIFPDGVSSEELQAASPQGTDPVDPTGPVF